jgi:hypothetical protein
MKPLYLSLLALAVSAAACGQDTSAPAQGALKVYTAIAAAARIAEDTDGVDVIIDTAGPVHVNANGDSIIRAPIAVGVHTIEVRDVRSTCALVGPNPTTVVVARDSIRAVLVLGVCQ